MNRIFAAAMSILLCACQRPNAACLARTRQLRERIADIDWSIVGIYDWLPYAEIPVGDGRQMEDSEVSDWRSPVVIQGSHVKSHGKSHPDDAALDAWLRESAGIFHPQPWPLYLLATGDTRVALVRRVAKILAPLGEVRVAVRPARVVQPWQPRTDRQAFFDSKTRRVAPEKDKERTEELVRSVIVPAEGCSEAIAVAEHPWMSPGARLARLPDAFEKCACNGDMDTMAALYWFQALEDFEPIRWHVWDDALAEQVGDDATYADLAHVLTERYLARHAPNKSAP